MSKGIFVTIAKSKGDDKRVAIARNNLSRLSVVEVTLCSAAAVPNAQIQILKAANISDENLILKTVVFKAVDKVKKQAFGYCFCPDEADYQGDISTAEEVEKACNSFMRNLAHKVGKGTGTGLEHSAFTGIGHPIQSAIDLDGGIAKAHGADPCPGGWWIGVQVTDDDTWEGIEKGTITGFSIGGSGMRTPIAGQEQSGIMKTFHNKVSELLKGLTKSDDAKSFLQAYRERKVEDDLWDIFSALRESITSILGDDDITDKTEAISNTIDEFKGAMSSFVGIVKAGAELNQGNVKLLTSVTESVQSVIDSLNGLLDKVNNKKTEKTVGEDEMDTAKILKAISELATVVDGVVKKVDKLEEGDPVEMSDDDKAVAATELGKSVEDITKAATEANQSFEDYVAAEKAKVKKTATVEGEGEKDQATILKAIGDLSTVVDGVVKKVDKLESKPNGRNGTDTSLEEADVTKAAAEKIENTPEGIIKSMDETAFSFR